MVLQTTLGYIYFNDTYLNKAINIDIDITFIAQIYYST